MIALHLQVKKTIPQIFWNELLHTIRIIPVKFQYNRIKNNSWTFMIFMGMAAILKMSNPKCITSHFEDHIVKFHYNRIKNNIIKLS